MLYMVVEHFRGEDPLQIMECDDASLLAEWMAHWEDLVEFEVIPVVTSEQAAAAVATLDRTGVPPPARARATSPRARR